jgi:hypothetical protein
MSRRYKDALRYSRSNRYAPAAACAGQLHAQTRVSLGSSPAAVPNQQQHFSTTASHSGMGAWQLHHMTILFGPLHLLCNRRAALLLLPLLESACAIPTSAFKAAAAVLLCF